MPRSSWAGRAAASAAAARQARGRRSRVCTRPSYGSAPGRDRAGRPAPYVKTVRGTDVTSAGREWGILRGPPVMVASNVFGGLHPARWLCGLGLACGPVAAVAAQSLPLPIEIQQILRIEEVQQGPQQPQEPPAQRLLGELTHPQWARRQAAVRGLIALGADGAAAVRAACDASDPVLAAHARRVFAAVHGATPEVVDRVAELLGERGSRTPAALVRELAEVGPGALDLAAKRLADGDGHAELYTAVVVAAALRDLDAGINAGDAAVSRVLELADRAGPALLAVTRDGGRPTFERLQALWLFAELGAPDKAVALAGLAGAPDAAVGAEALQLAAELARPADFDGVAAALQGTGIRTRQLLAGAFARRMKVEELTGKLGQRDPRVAALAAASLGAQRHADGLTALAERARALVDGGDQRVLEVCALALGEFADSAATAALVDVFAGSGEPRVRSAALAALRSRPDDHGARLCLGAGLFDDDPAVRLAAADAIAALQDPDFAPALVIAAGEATDDVALRARVVAALDGILSDARTARTGGIDKALEAFTRSVGRQASDGQRETLPWLVASREAERIVTAVRERIIGEFFHFGDKSKIDHDKLDAAAHEAIVALLDEKDSELELRGAERRLLERLLRSERAKAPERALRALGAVPFEGAVADLVRLTNAAGQGMIAHLGDRYSRLLPSNDPEGKPTWLPAMLDGNDKSNGFAATEKDGVVIVDFVMFDGPAWYAGLQAGDQLVRIGEQFAADLSAKELRKALNTEADFHILREGWLRPYPFHLVPNDSTTRFTVVSTMLPGQIGFVRLKQFEPGCSVKIEQAVSRLEQQGVKALILDLRGNPGGTVVDATAICDLFLPADKTITINETRVDEERTEDDVVRSTSKGADRDYPLAILVDHSSASASEMTSGSLQGNHRAVVVGQTSFGKGIGQSGMAIPGFSAESALGTTSSTYTIYLTMMRYYLPEGRRSIHGIGVEPDVAVRLPAPKGSAMSDRMRVVQHQAFTKYVDTLLEQHPDIAEQLAEFDGGVVDAYPDFAELTDKVKRWAEPELVRQLVRAELRRRILMAADDEERFARLLPDVQEDRVLRAAIEAIADDAGVALGDAPEYRGLQR
ncbi:MAG: HEAT repeat domain-containing protein [Planctomycetes bacterium]|nr:HEAT repeat domain-containing protein [Planctomycetota bacterium]